MKFGERLKMLRNKKGITQEDLARALDIPSSTIRRLEISDNAALPRRERLEAIANYFNVSVDFLLGREETLSVKYDIVSESGVNYKTRDYEGIIQEILRKYPNVDLTDADVKRKLMKAVDLVLDDYEQRR